jgi:hypothetical protein
MRLRTMPSGSSPLTPEEATAALAEADRLRQMGWRLVTRQLARLPLVWWGLAWMVTFPAAQFLPLGWALAVTALTGAGALAATRMGSRWDPTPGSTGWERRIQRGWWSVIVAGILIDLIAAPARISVYFLLPGALWGLALLLFAIVAGDLGLGLLGAGIAALATGLGLVLPDQALVLFGLIGGGAMAVLGSARVLRSARRR